MSDARVHVRYRGYCSGCSEPTQATPILTTSPKPTKAWIRCGDCGQITLCEQSATEAAGRLDIDTDE